MDPQFGQPSVIGSPGLDEFARGRGGKRINSANRYEENKSGNQYPVDDHVCSPLLTALRQCRNRDRRRTRQNASSIVPQGRGASTN
jgi:hypothetical protein